MSKMQTEIFTSSPPPPIMHIDSRARELADVLREILQTQTLLPRDSFNANPPLDASNSSCSPSALAFPSSPSCPDQSEEWVNELVPAVPFVSSTDKLGVGQRPDAIKFSEEVILPRMAKTGWNQSLNNNLSSADLNNPTGRIGPMEDPYGSQAIRQKTSSWKESEFGVADESQSPFSEAFQTFSAFESFGMENIPELLEVNKSNASSDNSMGASTASELMEDDGFNTASREEASANLFLHPGEVMASQCAGNMPPGTVMGHPCQGTSLPAMETTVFTMLPGFASMSTDHQAPMNSSSLKASSLFSVQSNPLFSALASSACDKESMKELVYRAAALKPIDANMEGMINKKKRKNVRISKDPQSVAARRRRERISYRIGVLQRLVPGGTKMDTASMLDEAINYLKFLKMQVQALERMEKSLNRMYWNHMFQGNNNNNFVYNSSCSMNNSNFFNNNNNNFYDLAATTTSRTISSTEETARAGSTTTSAMELPNILI